MGWAGVVAPHPFFEGKALGTRNFLLLLSKKEEKATRGGGPFLAWVDFHARSRFARSTIPEEKWGTTRSLRNVQCMQLPQRLSLIEFNFYDCFSHWSSNQITALILKYQLPGILRFKSFHRLPYAVFLLQGVSHNVMLQMKMSLKAKRKAIKPL